MMEVYKDDELIMEKKYQIQGRLCRSYMFIDCEELYLSNCRPNEYNTTTFTIYNDSEIPLDIYFKCDNKDCEINFLINKEVINGIYRLQGFFHETVYLQYKSYNAGEYEYSIEITNYNTFETSNLKLYTIVADKSAIDCIKIDALNNKLEYKNGEYELDMNDCYTNHNKSAELKIQNISPDTLDILFEKDYLKEVSFCGDASYSCIFYKYL